MGFPTKHSTELISSSSLSNPPRVTNPELVSELMFNTMVIYGPTGSRKTTEIGNFAKYIYTKTGKITRLVTMDGGGYAPVQDLVGAGIIEPWRLVEEERPLPMLVHVSKGVWPKNLKNGKRLDNTLIPAAKSLHVGAYAVEGWFSIANAAMRYLVSKGQKINEDVVSKFEEESDFGSVSFGAPSRGHYGFAQNFLLDLLRNFSGLGLERILYTSLEGKGEDKFTKALTYGPATAGGAITSAIPQYVGDCLHFEDFSVNKGKDKDGQPLVDLQTRAWFVSHPDPQTRVMWPAKARLLPSKVEEFKKIMGNGYFNLNEKSLRDYMEVQDELLASGVEESINWRAKIDAGR